MEKYYVCVIHYDVDGNHKRYDTLWVPITINFHRLFEDDKLYPNDEDALCYTIENHIDYEFNKYDSIMHALNDGDYLYKEYIDNQYATVFNIVVDNITIHKDQVINWTDSYNKIRNSINK